MRPDVHAERSPQTGPSAREKVTGAISWTILPRVVQLFASVFTSILIVRVLGPFNFGTLSVLRTVFVLVVVICSFGLGQAINRFVPELRVTDQKATGRALLFRSLWLQSAIWFALSAALLLLRGFLRAQYPTYADLLILGVLLSICEVAAGTIGQYAIAIYRTREMALATVSGTVMLAVATALLLHFGMKVNGVLIASAAGFAANTVILGAYLARPGRAAAPAARPSPAAPPSPAAQPPPADLPAPADSRSASPASRSIPGGGTPADAAAARRRHAHFPWGRLLSYAVPWIPNNILNFVVWRQSETFLLGIFRTRVEAGFFDLAYKVPQMVLEFVPGSVYPLVLAGFAETAAVAKEKLPAVIATYYRLLFFFVAPLSLFGLAMGDVLLARMYGESMARAGVYCQAFFVIFTLSFFGTPLSMTVYVVEKVWVNLVLNIGYAIVTLGLDLLLIPRLGLLGATIPTGLVTALTPIVRYLIARRYLKGIYLPWAFIGRAYLASCPMLAFFWAKVWVRHLSGLALCGLVAAGVTIVSYRLLRVLGPEEREFLGRSRFPGKDWVLRIL